MRHITYDINTKWAMTHNAFRRAKGKRRDKIRIALFELLRQNAAILQFNHENR
jgi:hypothetical protein